MSCEHIAAVLSIVLAIPYCMVVPHLSTELALTSSNANESRRIDLMRVS